MKWIAILLLALQSLNAMTLKDKFLEAEEGTFIVTEQNQLVTLLHLHTKNTHTLLFEEVSIPLHQVKKESWREWMKNGAHGHTSWILYELDLNEERVTECYSRSRNAWIPTQEMEAFLLPLISLELHYLAEEKRLQTGPSPKAGAVESRPWGPSQVYEGEKQKEAEYDVYTAKWPIDSSELSGKPIVLYFDKERKTFPFPYWLQVREGAIKFKVHALDSGIGLTSPCRGIPLRKPTFTSALHRYKDKLEITLDCPRYYHSYQLIAIDLSENPRQTLAFPIESTRNGETLTLSIDAQKGDALLKKGHEYLWVFSSDSPDVTIESPYRTIH